MRTFKQTGDDHPSPVTEVGYPFVNKNSSNNNYNNHDYNYNNHDYNNKNTNTNNNRRRPNKSDVTTSTSSDSLSDHSSTDPLANEDPSNIHFNPDNNNNNNNNLHSAVQSNECNRSILSIGGYQGFAAAEPSSKIAAGERARAHEGNERLGGKASMGFKPNDVVTLNEDQLTAANQSSHSRRRHSFQQEIGGTGGQTGDPNNAASRVMSVGHPCLTKQQTNLARTRRSASCSHPSDCSVDANQQIDNRTTTSCYSNQETKHRLCNPKLRLAPINIHETVARILQSLSLDFEGRGDSAARDGRFKKTRNEGRKRDECEMWITGMCPMTCQAMSQHVHVHMSVVMRHTVKHTEEMYLYL